MSTIGIIVEGVRCLLRSLVRVMASFFDFLEALLSRILDWIDDLVDLAVKGCSFAFGFVLALCGFALILAGLGIFVFQVYGWLKNGTWFEVPLAMLFVFFEDMVPAEWYSWLKAPDSWFGLHKIVVGLFQVLFILPLSLFLAVLGFVGFFAGWLVYGEATYERQRDGEP